VLLISLQSLHLPAVHKIDINNASLKEIAQFSYFRYALAKEIVIYRSMNGDIKNIEDLTKIRGFLLKSKYNCLIFGL
jgi:competence ComEA-like helix-hairpin-helix protein